MKSVVDMIPYAISVACDTDSSATFNLSFEIRAMDDTSNISDIETSNTTVRGNASISGLDTSVSKMSLFTSSSKILTNQSWGLYLSSASSSSTSMSEMVTKVFFYQA